MEERKQYDRTCAKGLSAKQTTLDTHLVWVLHDEVFALFQLHTDVDDAA